MEELEELEKEIKQVDEAGLQGGHHYEYFDDQDEDDDESISASRSPDATRTRTRKSSRVRRGGTSCYPISVSSNLTVSFVQVLRVRPENVG